MTGFETILITQVVGATIGKFFGLIMGEKQALDPIKLQRDFEKFLTNLEHKFALTVQEIIVAQFLQERFNNIKAKTIMATKQLQDYLSTVNPTQLAGDKARLDIAQLSIDTAYADLVLVCEEILKGKHLTGTTPAAVNADLAILKNIIFALQAVSALEVLILTKRMEFFPTLSFSVEPTLNSYIAYANQLADLYLQKQPFRISRGSLITLPGGTIRWRTFLVDDNVAFKCVSEAPSKLLIETIEIVYRFEGPPVRDVETSVTFNQRLPWYRRDSQYEELQDRLVYILTENTQITFTNSIREANYLLKEVISQVHTGFLTWYAQQPQDIANFENQKYKKWLIDIYKTANHFQLLELAIEAESMASIDFFKSQINCMDYRNSQGMLTTALNTKNPDILIAILPCISIEILRKESAAILALAVVKERPDLAEILESLTINKLQESFNKYGMHDVKLFKDQIAKLDINYQNPQTGMTVLHYEVQHRRDLHFYLLLSNGIDISIKDNKGRTAIDLEYELYQKNRLKNYIHQAFYSEFYMLVARKNNAAALAYYLNTFDVSVNVRERDGSNALHHCVQNDKYGLENINLLLTRHINPFIKNKEGLTAEELALKLNKKGFAQAITDFLAQHPILALKYSAQMNRDSSFQCSYCKEKHIDVNSHDDLTGRNMLHKLAERQQENELTHVLRCHPTEYDVEAKDNNQTTALDIVAAAIEPNSNITKLLKYHHLNAAAKRGDIDELQYWLNQDVDIIYYNNPRERCGPAILIFNTITIANTSNKVAMMERILIATQPLYDMNNVNARNLYLAIFKAAQIFAASHFQYDLVELIDKYALTLTPAKKFLYAAYKKDTDELKRLHKSDNSIINTNDLPAGNNALHISIYQEDIPTTLFLFEANIAFLLHNQQNKNPLELASLKMIAALSEALTRIIYDLIVSKKLDYHTVQAISKFQRNYLDIGYKDPVTGNSLLHIIALNYNDEVAYSLNDLIRHLTYRNASFIAKNFDQQTPIELAGQSWENTLNNNYRRGLHRHFFAAVQIGEIDEIKEYLANGIEPGYRDDYRQTALHFAVKFNRPIEIIELLLEYKFDINAKDHWYRSPKDEAIRQKNKEILKLFKKYRSYWQYISDYISHEELIVTPTVIGDAHSLLVNKNACEEVTCIRATNRQSIWRSNPADPYIYVSFSTTQLIEAYGNEPTVNDRVETYQFQSFKPKVRNKLKSLIATQWIDRAGLPIKFLLLNETVTGIRNKLVCFFVSKGFSRLQEYVMSRNPFSTDSTLSLSYPEHAQQSTNNADYKIIILNQIQDNDLNNEVIYNFLHETGHAFAELSHFWSSDAGIELTSCELTCLQTVMSYKDNCPPVISKELTVFADEQVSIFDPRSEVQSRIQEVYRAYPIELGPLDILAAEQFKDEWQERNTPAASLEAPANGTYEAVAGLILLFGNRTWLGCKLVNNFVNDCFEGFIKNLSGHVNDAVANCPSYFPPEHPSYWQQQAHGLLFKLPAANPVNVCAITGNSTQQLLLAPGYSGR
jgi:ankyrin repeat protein